MNSRSHSIKVSVALATYNGATFLREQLDSLQLQSRAVDELVLCDDRSTDATLTLARSILEGWPAASSRIRIEQNSVNLGVTRNFEKALSLCSGDVIFLCDQDDYWHRDKVARLTEQFERRPELLLVYSNAQLVGPDRKTLGLTQFDALNVTSSELDLVKTGKAFQALTIRNLVTGGTVALRRVLIDAAAPFPTEWVHDEWLAAIAAAIGVIDVLDDCLIDYRQHGGNQIGMKRRSSMRRVREVFSARGNFHDHELMRARILLARLVSLGDAVPAGNLSRMQERVEHLVHRASLPKNRLARIALVGREFGTGRYRRYGHGWRSVLRDLFEPLR